LNPLRVRIYLFSMTDTKYLSYVLVMIFGILNMTSSQFTDRERFIDRHNLGYVLKKEQDIRVITAEAKVLFHFQLPPLFNTTVKEINCYLMTDESSSDLCEEMKVFITELQELRHKALSQLERHLKWIYDIVDTYTPPLRSKRGIWSNFWSSVTGLAETSDVNKLQIRLSRIESGVEKAAQVWRTGTSHFVAALEAEKKRVDTINRLLRLERQSIRAVQEHVVQVAKTEQAKFDLLGAMLSGYISPMILELNDIEDLYNAVQMLHNGKIPYRFVSHAKLREGLHVLNGQLRVHHSELVVAITDLNYYYKSSDFHVFRYRQHLIISLHVPLTLKFLTHTLNLVRFQSIPIINPHENAHYTTLVYNYKWLAYSQNQPYFLTFKDLPRLRNDLFLDLRHSDSKLRQMNKISCSTAIIRGSLIDIKKLCRYSIYPRPMPTKIYRLSNTAFLFSNISDIDVTCHNKTVSIRHDTTQFVYNAHCGCSLSTRDFYIPFTSLSCMSDVNASVKVSHIINLPYLSEFLHYDVVKELRADLFLNRSMEAKLPKLPIASAEFERNLKLEQEMSLDLESAITDSKSDKQIYKSLSHYLYNRMIESQAMESDFDVFNVFTWITVAGLTMGVLAFLWAIMLHLRYKALYMMLLARLPKSTALPTLPWEVVYTKPTTTMSPKTYDLVDIKQELINILPVDLTLLLLIVVLFAGFLAFRLYKCCRAKKRHTYLYIQVSDEENSVKWLIASLSYLPIHYKVEASRTSSINLTQSYFSAKVSLSGMLKVICKPLNSEVKISREGQMYGWSLFKLRKILSNNYCHTTDF